MAEDGRGEDPPRRIVDLAGRRVAFVDEGRGPPLVLVHGNPCWSHVFRPQTRAFRARHRVVAPDLLGFGATPGPARGATFGEQADLVEALLGQLDLERVRLVVHDWGGPIGLRWAVRHPGRVAALVLVNTTVAPDFVPPPYWRPLVSELMAVRANVFVWGLPLALRAARRRDEWRRYRRAFRGTRARRALLRLERLDGFREVVSEVAAGLGALSVPTLVVRGEPDAYFRAKDHARVLAALPAARCEVLPGGGHFPMADRPEAFNRCLAAFLEDPALSAPS